MNSIISLLSSRAGEADVFVAATVFTVLSTVMFDAWVARGASVTRSRAVGVLLILVFLCMAAGGVADYAIVGKPSFIGLSLFLSGVAGLAIVPPVLLRHGQDRELRRMAAYDL